MSAELEAYGWGERWVAPFVEAAASSPTAEPGRIVRHDGSAVLAVTAGGRLEHLQVPPGTDPAPVVGDWVALDRSNASVVAVVGRHSLLRRQDPDGAGEQALVANLDLVLVVCGLDRPVKPGRIERCAALAWDAGAIPVVVLTKADLVADPDQHAEEVRRSSPGLEVLVTCAATGEGLDEVRTRCLGRTVVLLGESGAGKSTMTNALAGGEVAATGVVRGGDAKGRHTTTSRHLYPLIGGGVLVDTPGLRAVGLSVDADALTATFADVESVAARCRFADCRHDREPGCAVRDAVASGKLAPERWDRWSRMVREAEAAEARADVRRRRADERSFGRMAREAQRVKHQGRRGRRPR